MDYYSDPDSDTDYESDCEEATVCQSCYRRSRGEFREGYNVCDKCGVVKETCNIDHTGEWNNYSTDGSVKTDNSRCGFTDSVTFEQSTLSTTARGNSRIAQMVLWGSITHKDADAYYMKQMYTEIAETVGISLAVVNKACKLYRHIIEDNITRQNVRDGIKAAAFFQALSSESGYSYTISDVAKWFNIPAQIASAGNATITSILFRNNRPQKTPVMATQSVQIIKASDMIERFGNMFQFTYPLRLEAETLCKTLQKRNEFYGTHGSSLAAGVVYFFIVREKHDYHVDKVSERTGVSSGTIKKIFKSVQHFASRERKS